MLFCSECIKYKRGDLMTYKDAVTKLQVGGSVEIKAYKQRCKILGLKQSYIDLQPVILIDVLMHAASGQYVVTVTHKAVSNYQMT